MRVTVFTLYHRNGRLPAPAGPWVGHLVMKGRDDGTSDYVAQLIGVDERRLPHLHYCKTEIQMAGLVLQGSEIIPRRTNSKATVDRFRQTWWALTDELAIDSVRLQQLDLRVREIETLIVEYTAEHTWDDWSEPAAREIARLQASRELRKEAADALRQSVEARRAALAAVSATNTTA